MSSRAGGEHGKARHLPSEAPNCVRSWEEGPALCARLPAGQFCPRFRDQRSQQPTRCWWLSGWQTRTCMPPSPRRGQEACSLEGPAWAQPLGKRRGNGPQTTTPKRGHRCVKGPRNFLCLRGGRGGQEAGVAPQGRAVTPASPEAHRAAGAPVAPRPRLQGRAARRGQPRRAGSLPAPRVTGGGAPASPRCRVSRCR